MKSSGKFVAFSLALLPLLVAAQAYPEKPIKLVVPYPAGGVADTLSRAVGEQLGRRLGQPVVIDNKPGGKQIIGADFVAKSAPDGYTIFLGSVTSLSLNPAGIRKLPYNVERDFAPVTSLFYAPLMLVTNMPAKDLQDLTAQIKAAPGKYAYASVGAGTSTHLAAELYKLQTGANLVHVPYKGSAPAITDLLGGQVQLMFDGGTSSLPFVREGRLRLLAVTSSARLQFLPDVPTMKELGLKDYDVAAWFGIVAPAGTPKEIVDKLSREIKAIAENKDLRSKFAPNGVELSADGPAQFSDFIKAETARWRTFLKATNIDLDN